VGLDRRLLELLELELLPLLDPCCCDWVFVSAPPRVNRRLGGGRDEDDMMIEDVRGEITKFLNFYVSTSL
jgi:hypothetical protein